MTVSPTFSLVLRALALATFLFAPSIAGAGCSPMPLNFGVWTDCTSRPAAAAALNETDPSAACQRAGLSSGHWDGDVFVNEGSQFYTRFIMCYYGSRYAFGQNIYARWLDTCPDGGTWDPITQQCRGAFDEDENLGGSCNDKGNPVNTGTGNKFQVETDFAISGDLRFERYYNSRSRAAANELGLRWTHTYSRRVTRAGNVVKLSRPDGKVHTYALTVDGWVPMADVFGTLERLTDASGATTGWRYAARDASEVEQFDARGRLQSITHSDGRSLTLVHNDGAIENSPNDFLVTRVQDHTGRALTFAYANGRLQQVTSPDGAAYTYQFDAQDRLVGVTYPGVGAGAKTYHYNEASHTAGADLPYALTGISDESGRRFSTYRYAANGDAVGTEHAGGVDRHVFSYLGDAMNTAVIENPLGSVETRTFEMKNGVRCMASSDESSADGNRRQSWTHDDNGRKDLSTDANGWVTDDDYDDQGRLVQRIEAAAKVGDPTVPAERRTTQTTWHPTYNVPVDRRRFDSAAGLPGTLTARDAWAYNDRGQTLASCRYAVDDAAAMAYACGSAVDAPAGVRQTRMSYCEQSDVDAGSCPRLGLLLSTDGPRTDVSDITHYAYFAADAAGCDTSPATCAWRKGDLQSVTNALGQATTMLAYDGAGRVTAQQDANGVVTELAYPARGWLSRRSVRGADPQSETDDAITRIDYWPTGLVRRVTQPDGDHLTYLYDDAQRLIAIVDSVGNRIDYTLDAVGNRVGETTRDPSGAVARALSRIYSQLGHLQRELDATAVVVATHFHDAHGNRVRTDDAEGKQTVSSHDALNRLRQTIQDYAGLAVETGFDYDTEDRLTEVTDPKGLSTRYRYNGFGDLIELRSPDTGTTTYAYDSAGNRVRQTDARGIVSTYGYDALNRLTSVRYPNPAWDVDYAYDAVEPGCPATESFAIGRLTRMTDASGHTRYCHDRFGNLVRKRQVTQGVPLLVRYGYTLGGRLERLIYPDGRIVDYPRDAAGRVRAVGYRPVDGERRLLLRSLTWHPFGPAASWLYGDTRRMRRELDLNYRTTQVRVTGGEGLSLGYTYDPMGQLELLSNAAATPAPLRAYDYDAIGRLTGVQDAQNQPLQNFSYDATGNRLGETRAGTTTPYTYALNDHRLQNVGGVARQYDAAGNTLRIGGTARQFVYNDAGRLTTLRRDGAVVAQYRYNGRGERVIATRGAAVTFTVYDESGRWLGEYAQDGAPLQQVLWMEDIPVALVQSASTPTEVPLWIEPDHLGTPRAIIDPTRNVAVWRWPLTGEVFGNQAPQQDPDGDGIQMLFNLRFPGQYFDAESGLHYNYFRDYDPSTGRYVESDPAGISDGPSTYGYVHQNPLVGYDPLGLTNYRGFDPRQEAEMRQAVEEAKRKIEECQTCDKNGNCECFPGEKRKDRLIKKLNSATFIYKPDLGLCGYVGPINMLRGQVQVGAPAFGAGCCSLASTLAHEVNHLLGSGESSSYDLEEKCFGCPGRPE